MNGLGFVSDATTGPSGVNCPVCAVPVLPPAPSSSQAASCAVPSSTTCCSILRRSAAFSALITRLDCGCASVSSGVPSVSSTEPHTKKGVRYTPPEAMVFIMAAICTGDASRPPCPKLKFASWPLWASSPADGSFPASACSAPATGTSCPKPSCRDICKSVSDPSCCPSRIK